MKKKKTQSRPHYLPTLPAAVKNCLRRVAGGGALLLGGSALLLTFAVTAGITAMKELPDKSAIVFQIPTAADKQHADEFTNAHAWKTVTVKRRDTLTKIFKRHGVDIADAFSAVQSETAAPLNKIRPGEKMRLATDEKNALAALRYPLDPLTTLNITRRGEQFHSEIQTRTPEIRVHGVKATIWSNLLDAARSVGLEWETVYELAHLFAWQVDFTRDLRKGDQILIWFEELYLDGKKVATGDIVAAELVVSGRRLHAIRHREENGNIVYYDANGDGIERSFLRSPIKFGRVTSRFSPKRYHPILKTWRAHRGVDYGARIGTPIRTTGDGVVRTVSESKSYGRTVIVRHGEKYTTLYAHLSRFARDIKRGKRVQQGDIIGYVGKTGWATGPHLHYEFRVDGVHRNPLTVELPKSEPIDKKYLPAFLSDAAQWVGELQTIGMRHVELQNFLHSSDAESAIQ